MMAKINELIEKYCPNGVDYYKLGELGKFLWWLDGQIKI